MLGMLIGCALSLLNAMLRGVYYTRSALVSDADAELTLKSKPIRRLSRKSISDIISFVSTNRIMVLDEAALKLANKRIIYVVNSGGQPTSSNSAKLLAIQSAQFGRNVLLCDTTGQSEKKINGKPTQNSSSLPIFSMGNNISVMTGTDEAFFFTSKNFSSTIKDLTDRFDQVFLCSSSRKSQLGLMALAEFKPSLVLISGLRNTRKWEIKNVQTRQPIDLLFYD